MLAFQTLTNVKRMKVAVRATVATPLAASTASVLKAEDWGQTARRVAVSRRLVVVCSTTGRLQQDLCPSWSSCFLFLLFKINAG